MAKVRSAERTLGLFLLLKVVLNFHLTSAATCQGLSAEVVCTCDAYGHCETGTVQVDPWLQNTLKTQMEVQLDISFYHAQLLDAHNSFNNRAYGELYGSNDTCIWPPPYEPSTCTGIANQEFSLTDLLNFGIRALELDNWYCEGEMRIAHLGSDIPQICNDQHVIFSDSVEEIGTWLDSHEDEFIRLYINEKFDQGHDDSINGPFERYFGDRVLTPADLRDTYGGEWPTLRTMRQAGKSVVIAQIATAGGDESFLHQGKFIHPGFWMDKERQYFTSYPQCGGKNDTNALRYYSDSTHHLHDGEYLDGPTLVGYIDDYSEFVKCRIQYPGGDQITPQITATAVYTWAQDEPTNQITDTSSCILLKAADNRWYTPSDCSQEVLYACQNTRDPADWAVSATTGGYDVDTSACPSGYMFALPQNGYQHQKLIEVTDGASVWLNVAPLLDDYVPPTSVPDYTTPTGRAHWNTITKPTVFATTAAALFFFSH